MAADNQLPIDLLDWVARLAGSTVTRCTRHTARREAWQIETGNGARYFLRIDRALAEGQRSTPPAWPPMAIRAPLVLIANINIE